MFRDKLNLALIAGIVMAICGILVFSEAAIVKAQPYSETIEVMDQAGTTAITTINFPESTAGTEVITPYNDEDTSGSPQVFGGSSTPVATLISGTDYKVHCTISEVTGWTTLVADENLYLTDSTAVTKAAFDGAKYTITEWGVQKDTGFTVTTAVKNLYLTITLNSVYGKSGTSTLTILGESL